MVHSSYQIEEANAWWGPVPHVGKVAVASRNGPYSELTFVTLIDEPARYRVLACTHPEAQFTRAEVQDMKVLTYSPNCDWDKDSYEAMALWEAGAFVHAAAKLRHAYGLDNLHYLAEGVRHVLNRVPLEQRALDEVNLYGQLPRHSPAREDLQAEPYLLLPTSPYKPHGVWTYVPPDQPFDFRVRAECFSAKTAVLQMSLEDAALKLIDVRNLVPGHIAGRVELLTTPEHDLFRTLAAYAMRFNDDA